MLRHDRRALDAACATQTAADLAALRHPLPLYHTAALADWPEGIAALAAAGVPPTAADALVEIAAGSTLAEVLLRMTNDRPSPCDSETDSCDDSSGDSIWTPAGYFSAVGLAAAMGSVKVRQLWHSCLRSCCCMQRHRLRGDTRRR